MLFLSEEIMYVDYPHFLCRGLLLYFATLTHYVNAKIPKFICFISLRNQRPQSSCRYEIQLGIGSGTKKLR